MHWHIQSFILLSWNATLGFEPRPRGMVSAWPTKPWSKKNSKGRVPKWSEGPDEARVRIPPGFPQLVFSHPNWSNQSFISVSWLKSSQQVIFDAGLHSTEVVFALLTQRLRVWNIVRIFFLSQKEIFLLPWYYCLVCVRTVLETEPM